MESKCFQIEKYSDEIELKGEVGKRESLKKVLTLLLHGTVAEWD